MALGDEAKNADQIRDEVIEVIKAWRRGKLLPKASMLLGVLSEFGPVRGRPRRW
jgi:hypothetical protein